MVTGCWKLYLSFLILAELVLPYWFMPGKSFMETHNKSFRLFCQQENTVYLIFKVLIYSWFEWFHIPCLRRSLWALEEICAGYSNSLWKIKAPRMSPRCFPRPAEWFCGDERGSREWKSTAALPGRLTVSLLNPWEPFFPLPECKRHLFGPLFEGLSLFLTFKVWAIEKERRERTKSTV